MRVFQYAVVGAIGVSVGLGVAARSHQSPVDKLNPASLRNMLEGMGMEVKVLNAEQGKEKYEVPQKTDKLNIPVAFELSPSGNYVWMTVFLGDNKPTKRFEELLKENFNIQPTFFYITTKNNLMAAEPMDNRDITPAIIRRCLDKLVKDVDSTAKVWGD